MFDELACLCNIKGMHLVFGKNLCKESLALVERSEFTKDIQWRLHVQCWRLLHRSHC